MPDLPEVTQDFSANTAPYVAGIQALIAWTEKAAKQVNDLRDSVVALETALNSLDSKNVVVNVATDIGSAVTQVEALQTAINSLHGKDVNIGITQITKDLGSHASAVQNVTEVVNAHVDVTTEQTSAITQFARALNDLEGRFRPLITEEGAATAALIEFGAANLAAIQDINNMAAYTTAEAEGIARNITAMHDAGQAVIAFGIANREAISNIAIVNSALEESDVALTRFAIHNSDLLTAMAASGSAIDRQAFALRRAGQAGAEAAAGIQKFAIMNSDAIGSIQRMGDVSVLVSEDMLREATAMDALSGLMSHYRIDAENGATSTSMLMKSADLAAFSFAKLATSGGRIGTIIHWVVAGGAELAAVVIPALIAAGAAMAVMAQGAQMVQLHMQSLYTATEATSNMFHETMGNALGMRSALQQAQDAANPMVYSMLGDAIVVASKHLGNFAQMGLQVTQVMSAFAAKVAVDMTGAFGHTVENLLRDAVTMLTMLGQVLGNTGHALLNFANDMPGLAKVLLAIVDGISRLLLWVSNLPAPLITAAMAMEEIWRWGGLLAAVIVRIGTLFSAFIASGFGIAAVLTRIGTVVQSVGVAFGIFMDTIGFSLAKVGEFVKGITEMEIVQKLGGWLSSGGGALRTFGSSIFDSITSMKAWQLALVAVAVAGLAFLIYKLATAKDSIQQWDAALQSSLMKAKALQLPGQLMGDLAQATQKVTQTTHQFNQALRQSETTSGGVIQRFQEFSGAVMTAQHRMGEAQVAYQQLVTQQRNFDQWTNATARSLHTSFVGALVFAQQAGVNFKGILNGNIQQMAIAKMQIEGMQRSYMAMGASQNAVGADMNALAIQAGLQTTKVQQLNQAWDQYMQTLTQGATGLAQFRQSVVNIGVVTTQSSSLLSLHGGQMSMSIGQIANAMKSFGGTSSQVWQNFNNTVTGASTSLIDWLRTAGAEGLATGADLTHALADIIAQLIPMASKSKIAQSELIGLWNQSGHNVTTFGQLQHQVKGLNPSMGDLQNRVGRITAGMTQMSKVASNLGTVIQQQVTSTMAKAAVAALGLQGAATALDKALTSNATASNIVTARNRVLGVLMNGLGMTWKQANAIVNVSTQNLGKNAQANMQNALRTQHLTGQMSQLSSAMRNYASTLQSQRTPRQQLIQDLMDMGMKADVSKGKIIQMISTITRIPKSEVLRIIMSGQGNYNISGSYNIGGSGSPYKAGGKYLQFHAAGGLIHGGTPGKDSVPAMLMPGEAVVPKHLVQHVAPFLSANKVPGFASGGYVATTGNPNVISGQYLGMMFNDFHNRSLSAMINQMQRTMYAAEQAALAAAVANIKAAGNASGKPYSWNLRVYDQGGLLMPGVTTAINNTGRPERIMPPESAGGPGAGPIEIVMHLDGQTLGRATLPYIRTEAYRYNMRNSGKVTGVIKPT